MFNGGISRIDDGLGARMTGLSWRPDPRCPPLAALRLVTVDHWTPTGNVKSGRMVVARELAEEVLEIFATLHALEFPIARMELVDAFGANDDLSMAANNTSAFNFRNIAGTEVLSNHAFGVAIDINPLWNPMVVDGRVFPPAGERFLDRSLDQPGMITQPVVDLFVTRGWEWGGDWSPMKDYHHFAKPRPRL